MQNENQLDMSDCVQEQSNAVSAPPPQSPATDKAEQQDPGHGYATDEASCPLVESEDKHEADEEENSEKTDSKEEESAEKPADTEKVDAESEQADEEAPVDPYAPVQAMTFMQRKLQRLRQEHLAAFNGSSLGSEVPRLSKLEKEREAFKARKRDEKAERKQTARKDWTA